MNRFIFKKVIAMACFAVIMFTLTACGGNQAPTTPAINEPTITATPSPTPTQNVPVTGQVNEPATPDPEEAGAQSNQSVLTVEQAQNLVQEAFAGYEIISHNAGYDFMEGDVLHLFFEVSYSAFSGITDVVWVDTITGELETISGVEFLHGDDWFEDYDPYWMYRDGDLDPFGDDDWMDGFAMTEAWGLESLAQGHLAIFPELDLRLGMTVNEATDWLTVTDLSHSDSEFDFRIAPRGRFSNPTFMFEGLEFQTEFTFPLGAALNVNENDALRYNLSVRAWYQRVSEQDIANIAFRFVEMYGEPHYVSALSVAWEANGYFINLSDSTGVIITLSSDPPAWVSSQRR